MDFSTLLEQSKSLNTGLEDGSGLPMLERDLHSIDASSKKLLNKTPAMTTDMDITMSKARYLLAGSGFDADKLSRNLQSIQVASAFEPVQPLYENDVAGYLKHERENIIMTCLEEAKLSTWKKFHKQFVGRIDSDWENTKKEMLESFGNRDPGTLAEDLNRSRVLTERFDSSKSSIKSRSIHPSSNPVLGNHQLSYVNVISKLNEAIMKGHAFGLVASFRDVLDKDFGIQSGRAIQDSHTQELLNSWLMIDTIVGEPPVSLPNGNFVKEFLSISSLSSFQESFNRIKLLQRSIKYLEDTYMQYIKRIVNDNMFQAKQGGIPGTVTLVRAFLNVKFDIPNQPWPAILEDRFNEIPVWPQIFYCLRVGDLNAAWKVADESRNQVGSFLSYLKEYIASGENRQLSPNVWKSLLQTYQQHSVRASRDPFKLACFNLIGRCDLNWTSQAVIEKTQDFLWYRLLLVRVSPEHLPTLFSQQDYPLEDLQDMLVMYGPNHFSPHGRNPLLYFQILFLSLQFEKAIDFLFHIEQYRTESVQMAIVLSYYGILREFPSREKSINEADFNSISQFLIKDENTSNTLLNVALLIAHYIKPFSKNHPQESLEYLNLIPQDELRFKHMNELILETREFDLLLGSASMDGSRKSGSVQKFMPPDSVKRLCEIAAKDSYTKGFIEDAVILYDLSEKYDHVLSILIKQISQEIMISSESIPHVVTISRSILQQYEKSGVFTLIKRADLEKTFRLLLELVTFFQLAHVKKYEQAMEHISRLNLLPESAETVNHKVQSFQSLDESIRKVFSALLLTTMNILYQLYERAKQHPMFNGRPSMAADDAYLKSLQARGRALVTFASLISFRVPADISSQLIKLSVFMA